MGALYALKAYLSVVTNNSFAVAKEFSRPRLAVARARATSLRLAQSRKSRAGGMFLSLCARKESNLRPLSYQDSVLPLNYERVFGVTFSCAQDGSKNEAAMLLFPCPAIQGELFKRGSRNALEDRSRHR